MIAILVLAALFQRSSPQICGYAMTYGLIKIGEGQTNSFDKSKPETPVTVSETPVTTSETPVTAFLVVARHWNVDSVKKRAVASMPEIAKWTHEVIKTGATEQKKLEAKFELARIKGRDFTHGITYDVFIPPKLASYSKGKTLWFNTVKDHYICLRQSISKTTVPYEDNSLILKGSNENSTEQMPIIRSFYIRHINELFKEHNLGSILPNGYKGTDAETNRINDAQAKAEEYIPGFSTRAESIRAERIRVFLVGTIYLQ